MTEEKNSKSESKEEQPKLDQEQYDRLIECSKKGPEGIKQWNKWRIRKPDEKIWLEGAILNGVSLQGAMLDGANLKGAEFRVANLQGASTPSAE